MQEVTFIIGLPGSGKSTLVEYYQNHPFVDYKIYDDWMECTFNRFEIKEFNSECRFSNLIEDIKQQSNILITCIDFCKNDFLQKSEYYLKSHFPNLKVSRIYFENNPTKSESNIRYRDKVNGGRWEKSEKDEMVYHGELYVPGGVNKGPLYEQEIKNSFKLSKEYIIPKGSTIFPIVVQQTDS